MIWLKREKRSHLTCEVRSLFVNYWGNSMLRFLCLIAALSTTFISFTPKSARGEQPSRIFPYPILSSSNTDTPVCYIQTTDGQTLNLSSMCGKKPDQPAAQPLVTCPEITDPKRRALFAQSCGNNAECLATLGCQKPPRPMYLPADGSLPG